MNVIINIPDFRVDQCMKDYKTREICDLLFDAVKEGKQFPDNATNGEVFTQIFPYDDSDELSSGGWLGIYGTGLQAEFSERWWDSPYKGADNE